MNQILYIEDKKNNQKADIKTIVHFFCIAIIVFAIVFISQGSYAIYNISSQSANQEDAIPQINTEEIDGKLILNITHEKGISKVIYNWNNEESNIVEGNKQTSITKTLELPVGLNTLHIKVYDIKNKETIFKQEYDVEDLGESKIDFIIENNTSIMKIKCTDAKGLSYITYRWNDNSAETVEVDPSNPKIIERDIDIPFGLNTLTVVAVNKDGITNKKELEVKGEKATKVEARLEEGNMLVITLTDEAGIKSIYHVTNDTETIDVTDLIGKGKTVVEYSCQLEQNIKQYNIKLTIINNDDIKTEEKITINM